MPFGVIILLSVHILVLHSSPAAVSYGAPTVSSGTAPTSYISTHL